MKFSAADGMMSGSNKMNIVEVAVMDAISQQAHSPCGVLFNCLENERS